MNEEKRKRIGRERARREGRDRIEKGEKEEGEEREVMRGGGRFLGVFNFKYFVFR